MKRLMIAIAVLLAISAVYADEGAVWTTDEFGIDQNKNIYAPGEMVYLMASNLPITETCPYEIIDVGAGNPVVYSGNVYTDKDGEIKSPQLIWNAYGADAGEYKVEVTCPGSTKKSDNFKIEGSPVAYCGDGVINGPEACDAGDDNGVACVAEYETSCQYCTVDCTLEYVCGGYCGNGYIESPAESCEYDADCGDGFYCSGCQCYEIPDEPYCGDGEVNGEESCESDADCADGYTCDACECYPQVPYCGDGILDAGEECDDGNNVDGDGCSSVCEIEDTAVPEFSTIGAGIALLGAGAYLSNRRK